jgi:hypothetical protein
VSKRINLSPFDSTEQSIITQLTYWGKSDAKLRLLTTNLPEISSYLLKEGINYLQPIRWTQESSLSRSIERGLVQHQMIYLMLVIKVRCESLAKLSSKSEDSHSANPHNTRRGTPSALSKNAMIVLSINRERRDTGIASDKNLCS